MKSPKSILIVPDAHIPFCDIRAWSLMISVARDKHPDIIVVLGDFGDFYSISRFSKDPTRVSALKDEVAESNRYLDVLDSLGAKTKIFIAGNHCYRLERYLMDKAPALFTLFNIPDLYRLRARGWKYVAYRDHIRIGKVYFTHDVGATGRTSGHKNLDTYRHSIVTGHSHRLIYVVESDAIGQPMLSAQFGWLGDVTKVDYTHKIKAMKDWALGFGWGYLDEKTGLVHVRPVPIVNYSCEVGGKIY